MSASCDRCGSGGLQPSFRSGGRSCGRCLGEESDIEEETCRSEEIEEETCGRSEEIEEETCEEIESEIEIESESESVPCEETCEETCEERSENGEEKISSCGAAPFYSLTFSSHPKSNPRDH